MGWTWKMRSSTAIACYSSVCVRVCVRACVISLLIDLTIALDYCALLPSTLR